MCPDRKDQGNVDRRFPAAAGRPPTTSAATFRVVDPATEAVIAELADAGLVHATAAVDKAAAALTSWRCVPARDCSDILRRTFDLMLRDRDDLAALISAENGKSSQDARAEVVYAADFFRWFSEEAVRPDGSYGVAPSGGAKTVVTHHPVGVAALVTPWNFPAAMVARKVAPALAAGCSVVLKPAAETPLTALALARLLQEAGLPEGVLNLVVSTRAEEVVGGWLNDERVRALSFTGSTRVGRELLRHAADRVVITSMELGGNAPFIICEDADVDAAVAGAMVAKLRGGGQACTAANRFYVHATVIDEFVRKFGAEVAALTVGPASSGSDIGPLISAAAVSELQRKIDEAIAAGASLTHRAGPATGGRGYFLSPVVLLHVDPDAAIVREESFGPVAPVIAWTEELELLRAVNSTEFGLAAYVYSRDLQRAIRLSESIDAGMVGINRGSVSDPSAPFGGVKQSGLGREGAREGLREFQETQYLSIAWP